MYIYVCMVYAFMLGYILWISCDPSHYFIKQHQIYFYYFCCPRPVMFNGQQQKKVNDGVDLSQDSQCYYSCYRFE